LERIGYQWVWWTKDKPAFDIFNEYEPDLYINPGYEWDRATIKSLVGRPHIKVIAKGKNLDTEDFNDQIDTTKYPIDIATNGDIDFLVELKDKIPNLWLYNYYHKNSMPKLMGGWDALGIPTVGMMPAADIYTYRHGKEINEALRCDVCIVSGYWPYKAKSYEQFIKPLCYPVGKYNIKIFGGGGWPYPQYCGFLSPNLEAELYRSATICLNVHEPHSRDFGFDCNERTFKVIASGGFCLTDYVKELFNHVFTYNELPCYETLERLEEQIAYYINNPDLRHQLKEECYKTVMAGHTYNHRLKDLLMVFGMEKDSAKTLQIL
jgi:hypothetical protein